MIKFIREICQTEDLYLAVSMGVDSLAACDYLRSIDVKFTPIHFNHQLRRQNILMENQFRSFIANNYVDGYNRRIGSTSDFGPKTESECRKLRLKFYSEVCIGQKNPIIITAHHLDDVVESYLLNCFRGHANYKPFNLVSDFGEFKIAHPFLLTEKADFERFIENNDLGSWVVKDETNDQITGSRRNWIRNNIIPEMAAQKISLKKYCRRLIHQEIEDYKSKETNES